MESHSHSDNPSNPPITHDRVLTADFCRSFVPPAQIETLNQITTSLRETILDEANETNLQTLFTETIVEESISGYHHAGSRDLTPAPLPPGTRTIELELDKTEEVNNYVFEKIKELMAKLATENIITPTAPSMVGQTVQIPLSVVPHFKSSGSRSGLTEASSQSKDVVTDPTPDPGILQAIKDLMNPAGLPNLSGQRVRVALPKYGVSIEAVSRVVLREKSFYLDPNVSRERKVYNLLGLTAAGSKIKRMLTIPP